MILNTASRIVYGLFGILYLLVGTGSMLMPTGWLPQSLVGEFLTSEMQSPFVGHLLQEFGTVVLALGFAFLWYAKRREQSLSFHWAMTFYFSLDSLIHWIGPDGIIGSWSRGLFNTAPLAVMLMLGLLQLRASGRKGLPSAA